VATGQGVFYLDRTFSNVPGIRLQQFNRSPQVEIAPDESNADFIQVAIPFKALGDLRPGDTVKLAAIVAAGDIDSTKQTERIDSAALATFLSGEGHGKVLLGPVHVRLAERK
jgi:hypothetical protein